MYFGVYAEEIEEFPDDGDEGEGNRDQRDHAGGQGEGDARDDDSHQNQGHEQAGEAVAGLAQIEAVRAAPAEEEAQQEHRRRIGGLLVICLLYRFSLLGGKMCCELVEVHAHGSDHSFPYLTTQRRGASAGKIPRTQRKDQVRQLVIPTSSIQYLAGAVNSCVCQLACGRREPRPCLTPSAIPSTVAGDGTTACSGAGLTEGGRGALAP